MICADNFVHLATAGLFPIMHKLLTTNVPRDQKKPACVVLTNTPEQAVELFEIALELSQGTTLGCKLQFRSSSTTSDNVMEGLGVTILVTPTSHFYRLLTSNDSRLTSCKFLLMTDLKQKDLIRAPQELYRDKKARQTIVLGRCMSEKIQEACQDLLRMTYIFISVISDTIIEKNERKEELHEEDLHEEDLHEEEIYAEEVHKENLHNEELHKDWLHKVDPQEEKLK